MSVPSASGGTIRSKLYLLAVVWAAFVLATGFCVDGGGGLFAGIAAAIAIVCLAISLRGWQHLLALPLYLFFALEVLVAIATVAKP
ncbi:MAG: hypothetical protein CMJ58_08720 [Planctomycetaceae bacterium]|nr:hypothetical protein [Planctomycetaceae bacterium]